MPSPKTNPSQYVNQGLLSASTSTGEGVDIGFNASYLRIENAGEDEVYLTLGSTAATTADYPLSTGDVLTMQPGPLTRDFAVSRNTTTTDLTGIKVLALG